MTLSRSNPSSDLQDCPWKSGGVYHTLLTIMPAATPLKKNSRLANRAAVALCSRAPAASKDEVFFLGVGFAGRRLFWLAGWLGCPPKSCSKSLRREAVSGAMIPPPPFSFLVFGDLTLTTCSTHSATVGWRQKMPPPPPLFSLTRAVGTDRACTGIWGVFSFSLLSPSFSPQLL